jgi:glycosyltransferase involved in cell wall biosynthesis
MKKSNLKVALAHDYLREYGGAERVMEAIHEIFPTAPVYVAFKDEKVAGVHWQKFKDWDIRESWLAKIPFYKKLFSPLRIFSPQYFQSFKLRGYDVVISSTNAYFSKAITVPKDAVHICYCHTPARSLYGYTTMTDWKKNPVIRVAGTLINHYLRTIDVKIAHNNVDYFIANSKETAKRIEKFYRLPSTVIYPPVNVPETAPTQKTAGQYYLYVNRLAFSKHPELAVEACNRLKLPLKIVGTGKMESVLKQIAGPTVELLGGVSDEELHKLYLNAKALIYPVEDEDFGIVPVEAMGYGLPVIAHRSGGPKETIIDGKTGIFFENLNLNSVMEAIQQSQKTTFNRKAIYTHALKFSKQKFQENLLQFIEAHRKKVTK